MTARRTRVLLVIAGLPAGGAERQMTLLARSLDRSSFEVGLLIFNAEEKIHYREVLKAPPWFRALDLSPRKDRALLLPRLMIGIAQAVRDFAPDMVHASLNVANHAVRASALALRWRTPIMTSVRVDFRSGYARRDKLMERLLWRRSAHVVCNVEATRQQLISDLGMPPDRVSTIPIGVDMEFLGLQSATPPAWWPEGPVALTVGRFTTQKNHLGLISALAEIAGNGGLSEWKFVFLGEGPLESEVVAAVTAAGLRDRITVRPPITDIAAAYRAARLLIMPSLFEGMPNAAVEATALACPVAIAAAANRAGVVVPGLGWVLDGTLAPALRPVLALPAETLAETGRRAAADVAERFSADRMVRATAALYRDIVGAPPVVQPR